MDLDIGLRGIGATGSIVEAVLCRCLSNQRAWAGTIDSAACGIPACLSHDNCLACWPNVRGEAPLPKVPFASIANTMCPPNRLDMTRAPHRPPASSCPTVSTWITLCLDEPRHWELPCTARGVLVVPTSGPAGPCAPIDSPEQHLLPRRLYRASGRHAAPWDGHWAWRRNPIGSIFPNATLSKVALVVHWRPPGRSFEGFPRRHEHHSFQAAHRSWRHGPRVPIGSANLNSESLLRPRSSSRHCST